MEERTTGQNEIAARIGGIEHELRSLRGSFDKLSRHLDSEAYSANRSFTLQARWEQWYVSFARLFLRADVSDLFDRRHYSSRNPGLKEAGTDPVYHYLRSESPVSPHWLFDREYYLRLYPDVKASKTDPLVHFLRTGWREGRNPHPLFRTLYYLEQAPELRTGKLNPVTHYMQVGAKAGLNPHPLFDGEYYRKRYPDIVTAELNPLTHYVLFGAAEGRQPHPWFDTSYYHQRHPDVAAAGVEAIQHYSEHGAAEGRNPHALFDTAFYQDEIGSPLGDMTPLEHFVRYGEKEGRPKVQTDCLERFLPAVPFEPAPPRGGTIDIVVPVYKGLAETRACIESVLGSSNREPYELIVIDDCSPDPALSAWLVEASASGSFTLLVNERNLGFVATVNRGMQLHPGRDILLLNSDTTVANDWLDRLVRCAYGTNRIGTVTPLSNNATICSYPRFCEDNPLPQGVTAAELDRLAAVTNQGRFVDLPTAVGFCMYIRRDCLTETGLFDVERFGKGYGEENDFSLRAAAKGWRNVLAADVFVYHAGSVSFAQGATLLRESGVRALVERYPHYPALICWHVARDAALPYRIALTAARLRESLNPTVLIVTHDLGGGIPQHIEELVESQRGNINFLELRPLSGSKVLLTSRAPGDALSLELDVERKYEELLALLRSCGVTRMHIHQVLRHSISIEKLRHDLNVPMDFTVHDYMAICPRFVLAKPDGRYCGEPAESGCNECIRTTLPYLNMDIGSWRAKYSWLVDSADRVIAPSADAASRISRRFPGARIQSAVHPLQLEPGEQRPVEPPKLEGDQSLRIAVLGVMTWHKGLENLEHCARLARERNLPLDFVLVGYCEPQVREAGPFSFRETGEYARPDLPAILEETAPGLVWFPQRWPETFSYTLSACLEQGYPVAATQLGAFPERLSNRPWTWVHDWDLTPEQLIELFLRIRQSMVAGKPPHPAPARPLANPCFYDKGYRAGPLAQAPQPAVDLREPGRRSVIALLSSYESGQMQSCGYIRAYLPLLHDNMESLIRLTVTTPVSALRMLADTLLVQRTTVPTMALAEELVQHCERHGIRLIYETDDDLFNIDLDHADGSFYKPLIEPAELIARRAAVVFVSSPVLRKRMAHLNPNIRVVPNALDEALWFSGKKPFRANRKPVRILYMGTMTHSRDLAILEEPMRKLKQEFGPGVELDLIGIVRNERKQDWFNSIEVPSIYGHSYPLFTEWIRRENKWDFAVAPLVNDSFNQCKSYIKYLDYAALGLAGIYSGIGVFEGVVKQGETGIIVPDDASWHQAMRLLVTDAALRRAMGKAAYQDVEGNHTLAAQILFRRELWN